MKKCNRLENSLRYIFNYLFSLPRKSKIQNPTSSFSAPNLTWKSGWGLK